MWWNISKPVIYGSVCACETRGAEVICKWKTSEGAMSYFKLRMREKRDGWTRDRDGGKKRDICVEERRGNDEPNDAA